MKINTIIISNINTRKEKIEQFAHNQCVAKIVIFSY